MLGVTTNNLLTNFEERINNGFSVIEGDGGSQNYRNMGVSGVVKMKKDQHASVFLYAHSDNNWQIQSESGFSCHKLAEKEGFHADKDGDSELGTNWQELKKWRVQGFPTLYSTKGFDPATGRFKVQLVGGAYYCYAQVRLDDASRSGIKRLIISRNQEMDVNNGLHAVGGNYGSTNYRSMRVAGNAWINAGETVSLFVYSSSDTYTAQSESGFGCHKLATQIGFHADLSATQSFGSGWRRVTNWRTGGNEFLYSKGTGFTQDGYYVAPHDGYYICTSVMRIDSASTGVRFDLHLAVNDNRDRHNGLQAVNGYGSSNYRPIIVAGSVYMERNSKLAVWIHSNGDNSWTAHSESGFGCHLIETYADDCPSEKKAPKPKTTMKPNSKKPSKKT